MNFQNWSSRNAFVFESGSRNIKTMVGQLDAELQTAGYRCNISSKEAVLTAGAMMQRWAPQTCYTLRGNSVCTVKDLISI